MNEGRVEVGAKGDHQRNGSTLGMSNGEKDLAKQGKPHIERECRNRENLNFLLSVIWPNSWCEINPYKYRGNITIIMEYKIWDLALTYLYCTGCNSNVSSAPSLIKNSIFQHCPAWEIKKQQPLMTTTAAAYRPLYYFLWDFFLFILFCISLSTYFKMLHTSPKIPSYIIYSTWTNKTRQSASYLNLTK